MSLDLSRLKQIVYDSLASRDDEISCGECFEQLDTFVDLILANKNAEEAMPLVEDHLQRCKNCRQEFEALLSVLRFMDLQGRV